MRKILGKYKNLTIVVKATLWYTIANVLVKGVAILSMSIFTRVMTEEQYGTCAIFQSWYSIIIFTSLNIFLGGYTKGLLKYENNRDKYTSSSLAMTSFMIICWGIVYLVSIKFWTRILQLSPILMAAIFIELLIMPVFEFWSARSRLEYHYKHFVFATVWMSVFSIVLGVVAVMNTTQRVEAKVFAEIFAKATVCVPIFLLLVFRGKMIFNKEYWKYNLGFIVDDPCELIGRQIINSKHDFLKFINDVIEKKDPYRDKRHEVFDKSFKFHDGNSS